MFFFARHILSPFLHRCAKMEKERWKERTEVVPFRFKLSLLVVRGKGKGPVLDSRNLRMAVLWFIVKTCEEGTQEKDGNKERVGLENVHREVELKTYFKGDNGEGSNPKESTRYCA